MRLVLLLAVALAAPLAGAHHLPAAETYECDVEVGAPASLTLDASVNVNGEPATEGPVDVGACRLVKVDAGYGLGWGIDFASAPAGCWVAAHFPGDLFLTEVARGADLPPGTVLHGRCDALGSGLVSVEISRLVGIPEG